MSVKLDKAEEDKLTLEGYTSVLRGAGMESEAVALEQTAAGPGGMQAVRAMTRAPQFAQAREAMQRTAENRIQEEKLTRLQQKGGEEGANTKGQISSLRAMLQGPAGKEQRIQLMQAEKRLRAGDVAGAKAIVDNISSTLSPEQQKFVQSGGKLGAEAFKGVRDSAEALRMGTYTTNAMDQTTAANAEVVATLEGDLSTPEAQKAAIERVEGAKQIDEPMRKEMLAAMKGGDWEAARTMAGALPTRIGFKTSAEGYDRLSKELFKAADRKDPSEAKAFIESGQLPLRPGDKKKMLEALDKKDWDQVTEMQHKAERAASQTAIYATKTEVERLPGGTGEALAQQAMTGLAQKDLQTISEEEGARRRMVTEGQKDKWATPQQKAVEVATKGRKPEEVLGIERLPGEGAGGEAAGAEPTKGGGTREAPKERTIKMSGKLIVQRGDKQFTAALEEATGESGGW
jgi:hypothetical protein